MNKKRGIIAALIVVAMVSALWYLKKSNDAARGVDQGARVQVVTSFYPLYFFTSQIGGDRIHVTNITPSGGEPHDYEPTPQDIVRIANSDLLVMNGGGLETWAGKVRGVIDPTHTRVVEAAQDIINQTMNEEGDTVPDYHVWLAPLLAQTMVEKITTALVQVDPENKTTYESNAKALKARLSALDVMFQQGLANCRERNIITAHASFGYLAAAYRLRQTAITGISPDAEPSPRQLGEIVGLAKKNNIKYIFFESLISPKLSETIAREVGAQTLVLNPIEGLTPEEVSRGEDYFTEMAKNLKNLQTACQ